MSGIKIQKAATWRINGNKENIIYLLTPEELEALPELTEVRSIFGSVETIRKGKSLDTETRGGYTAFGLTKEQIDPVCFVEMVLDNELI